MSYAQGSARGHRSITATHRKTLEIAREAEIGSTASCVVAVGAQIDEQQVAKLRGPVELTISTGRLKDTVTGVLNPAFRPGDPLIVRRAAAVTRDALLIDADRVAADLDRHLVAALRDPSATIEIELRQAPAARRAGPALGALVVDPGPLWRAGDPAVEEADLRLASPLDADALAAALHTLEAGGRVLAHLSNQPDPVAISLIRAAADAGHAVLPAASLPPIAAVLAVAGVPLDRLAIRDGSQQRPPRLPEGACRLAVDVRGDHVEDWLQGAQIGLVSLDLGTPREQHIPWRARQELDIPGGRGRRAIVLAFSPPAQRPGLDPVAAALAAEMLAGGASSRDVALAVQRASGLSRREAYDVVLSLRRTAETSSVERPEPRTSR